MGGILPTPLAAEATRWKMNMREFLQRYGTEAHREIFGTDFWVDHALPLNLNHRDRLLVVTDMRFPNEIDRVKALGGVCVKVVRDVETGHSNHPSEQNLDHTVDYFLDNTGTIVDLTNNVETLLNEIYQRTTVGV